MSSEREQARLRIKKLERAEEIYELKELGAQHLSESIAFACQMFKEHRLSLWQAAQTCSMTKFTFAGVLTANKIPVIDYSGEEPDQELALLKQLLP
ncbi:UPF0175 family protein [Breznakiellaceae bacterium SP9]